MISCSVVPFPNESKNSLAMVCLDCPLNSLGGWPGWHKIDYTADLSVTTWQLVVSASLMLIILARASLLSAASIFIQVSFFVCQYSIDKLPNPWERSVFYIPDACHESNIAQTVQRASRKGVGERQNFSGALEKTILDFSFHFSLILPSHKVFALPILRGHFPYLSSTSTALAGGKVWNFQVII